MVSYDKDISDYKFFFFTLKVFKESDLSSGKSWVSG
jgi:hypothetical protein